MRCLLLHPDDDPIAGARAPGRWDRVVDFGIAGPATYDKWKKVLGCEVEPSRDLDREDFLRLRAIYRCGLGHVVDREGLDWWDLTWIRWLDPLVKALRTARFLSSLGSDDEVLVNSEEYFGMVEALAPGRARRIGAQGGSTRRKALDRVRGLKFSQILEVLGDKYDGHYRWRRLLAPAMGDCGGPVVLMPSAYGNASATVLRLAARLPEQNFLLVTTRRSARVPSVPSNVKHAQLASYARLTTEVGELGELLTQWEGLLETLVRDPVLGSLCKAGCFDKVPLHLREGLAIRNCWARVLDRERVSSVLCPDEKNPYTRIPVLLGHKRGIPTLACHHGALDGRYRFTDVCAGQFLAKNEMEREYMVETCRVPEHKVRASTQRPPMQIFVSGKRRKLIVFFSEPYELSKCRAAAVYAEVLPSLARVAAELGAELVVKLHPFESLRHRAQLAKRVLAGMHQRAVRFTDGPITQALMEQTRCSVTVASSAAVDCAMQGIPAFLCLWLDRYGFGYGEQYVKFRAALPLRTPEDIADIPKRLEQFDASMVQGFSSEISPELFRELLFSKQGIENNAAEEEHLWA